MLNENSEIKVKGVVIATPPVFVDEIIKRIVNDILEYTTDPEHIRFIISAVIYEVNRKVNSQLENLKENLENINFEIAARRDLIERFENMHEAINRTVTNNS